MKHCPETMNLHLIQTIWTGDLNLPLVRYDRCFRWNAKASVKVIVFRCVRGSHRQSRIPPEAKMFKPMQMGEYEEQTEGLP